ncbi:MAG: tetratricopeptide repeat protein, partial [Chloroflexi bacterium]
MAKISLHNYLDKVDQLLEENQFGDAAQHCLHILMQFPRHLDSYRALAKALLGQRKHHEAIEIFQRVLSAEPNDLLAHIALSDLYRTEMQADLSNWHLQRALEIEPFNEAIQAEYREVFSLDEDEDIASTRVPLNHAALGHLYLRGELFDQATAVLQKTLTENPERIDQELLLAEALWRNGDFHEAEDVCQHVLEKLPNCLTANAILSHILLEGNRVSEAQPFLRRVQSLVQTDQEHANYDSPVGRALTATGSPTLPGQISLKVWDETAVSATREEPTADWVSEIPFGETADSGEPVAEPDLASDPGDMFGWLKGVTAELQGEPPLEAPGSKKQEGPKGETDWFVDKALEDKSASPDDHSVTDWLEGERAGLFENGQIGDEAPAVAGSSDEDVPSPLPDWLAKETVQPIIDEVPEAAVEQEDMPEWLNEVADSDFEPMQLNPETASQWLVESEDALVEGVADEEPVDE